MQDLSCVNYSVLEEAHDRCDAVFDRFILKLIQSYLRKRLKITEAATKLQSTQSVREIKLLDVAHQQKVFETLLS